EARGPVVDQWQAPGRAADQWLVRDPAALRPRERGPAVLEAELRKAADLVAACQGQPPALVRDLARADQAAISQAAVQRLASSVISWTFPVPRPAQSEQAAPGVQAAPRVQAVPHVPVARQPTSYNKARYHSYRQ